MRTPELPISRNAPVVPPCFQEKIILIENIVRILVQRIKEGKVTVAGEEISRAGAGLCLFIGIAKGDTQEDALRKSSERIATFCMIQYGHDFRSSSDAQ